MCWQHSAYPLPLHLVLLVITILVTIPTKSFTVIVKISHQGHQFGFAVIIIPEKYFFLYIAPGDEVARLLSVSSNAFLSNQYQDEMDYHQYPILHFSLRSSSMNEYAQRSLMIQATRQIRRLISMACLN